MSGWRSARRHERAGAKPRPSLASGFVCSPTPTTTLHLPSRGSGLVDLLIARRGRLRAYLDRGVNLIELKVVCLPVELSEVHHVLGVTGVGHSLCANALVGVVSRAGNLEGLVHIATLSLLLDVLVQLSVEVEAVEVFVVIKDVEEVQVVVIFDDDKVRVVVAAVVPTVNVRHGSGGSYD